MVKTNIDETVAFIISRRMGLESKSTAVSHLWRRISVTLQKANSAVLALGWMVPDPEKMQLYKPDIISRILEFFPS